MASEHPSQTLIVGLSGPSSSGKTTLARLLRSIFNITADQNSANSRSIRLFILHEDDFYKTDKLIPLKTFTSSEHGTRELEDWDCVEALDLSLLESTLNYVKQHGTLPPDMFSKEDRNEIGNSGVPDDQVQQHGQDVQSWLNSLPPSSASGASRLTICLLDGFLLYPPPPPPPAPPSSPNSSSESSALHQRLSQILAPLLSLRLFLPSTRDLTIHRRARRTGYVTLEGFWADPPGYVEDVVWPNYSQDHAWLFKASSDGGDHKEEDVQTQRNIDSGIVNRRTAEQARIEVGPGAGDVHMTELLQWGVERLKEMIEKDVSSPT